VNTASPSLCRSSGNESETGHILCLPGAKERLKLFKADIHEEGSFDSAVQGCEFVIHLAISMDVMDIDAEVNNYQAPTCAAF